MTDTERMRIASMTSSQRKRLDCRYYTTRSPFSHSEFHAWAKRAVLPDKAMADPSAGAGDLIDMIREKGLVGEVHAFDISPAAPFVEERDSFADYPDVAGVAVTNPPYMARNSARRRKLPFPETQFQDLYLHSLDLMLANSEYVAAIIPAAFGTLNLFRDRLTNLIDLPFRNMFEDTHHPVCLCLFESTTPGATFWSWERCLGAEDRLRSALPCLPDLPRPAQVVFNVPDGLLGLRAVDTTAGPTIEFVRGSDIDPELIKISSRSVTRLDMDGVTPEKLELVIERANVCLERIRRVTADIILTPFMGVRQNGAFRRRLNFRTARVVLTMACEPDA